MKGDKTSIKYYSETIGKTGNKQAHITFENSDGNIVKLFQDDLLPTKFYEMIVNQANKFGYPVNYQTDLLFHDKFNLWFYEPTKFIWVLRENGTGICLWKESAEFITYHLDNTPLAYYFYGSYNPLNPLSGYKLVMLPPNKVKYYLDLLPSYDEF